MAYDRKVKAGHIRAAVRQATDRGKGGVLSVKITNSKTGKLVIEVLREKHPHLQEVYLSHPECSAFEYYDTRPKVLPLDVTAHEIEETVRKMGGSGGPSRADSAMLKDWCTRFSAEYEELREELAAWTQWLANRSPPRAEYRALTTGRLVALDKNPGVRPVGIGEAIRRLMAKLVHTLTTTQAMEACGNNNLCGGLKDGIEGEIHASKRAFGKGTPPNAVSSDIHPRGANGLETLWEGISEPNDSGGEDTDGKVLLTQPPADGAENWRRKNHSTEGRSEVTCIQRRTSPDAYWRTRPTASTTCPGWQCCGR